VILGGGPTGTGAAENKSERAATTGTADGGAAGDGETRAVLVTSMPKLNIAAVGKNSRRKNVQVTYWLRKRGRHKVPSLAATPTSDHGT
jgi:hypothetical protein